MAFRPCVALRGEVCYHTASELCAAFGEQDCLQPTEIDRRIIFTPFLLMMCAMHYNRARVVCTYQVLRLVISKTVVPQFNR